MINLFRSCLLPLLVIISCTVPVTPPNEEPFRLLATGPAGETISPYDVMLLRFTHPVAALDSVKLRFSPPFVSFGLDLSETGDTLSVILLEPLDGETRYTLHLTKPIVSTDGFSLLPGTDSVILVTAAREQEPNDNRMLADTLPSRLFGSVSTANDTDWFVIPAPLPASFSLRSTRSTSQFDLRDSLGEVIATHTATLTSDPEHPPAYLTVHARDHSNGGYYELTAVGN